MEGVEKLRIRGGAHGVILAVKVVPGSSRDRIAGVLGDALKVTVATPAERGKANAAVGAILAGALDVDKKSITLVSGQTRPRKEFRIEGVSAEQLRKLLQELNE